MTMMEFSRIFTRSPLFGCKMSKNRKTPR